MISACLDVATVTLLHQAVDSPQVKITEWRKSCLISSVVEIDWEHFLKNKFKVLVLCLSISVLFNFGLLTPLHLPGSFSFCPVKTIYLQIHWFRLFQCLWYTERFSVPSCVCKKSTKTPLGLAVKCIITKLKTSCYSELAAWQQRYDDLIEYDAYQHIKLPNSTWSCPSSARCLFVGCRMTLAIHSFTSKTLAA